MLRNDYFLAETRELQNNPVHCVMGEGLGNLCLHSGTIVLSFGFLIKHIWSTKALDLGCWEGVMLTFQKLCTAYMYGMLEIAYGWTSDFINQVMNRKIYLCKHVFWLFFSLSSPLTALLHLQAYMYTMFA